MIVNILIALSMIGHNISASLFNVQASCCATYLDHPIVTSVTTCRIDCTPGWHFGAIYRRFHYLHYVNRFKIMGKQSNYA